MNNKPPRRGVKRRARNTSRECKRATRLEKYYTKPEVARLCLALLEPYLEPDTLLIEPSAGAGAFINETDRNIVAFDIDPDADMIIKRDFLSLPVKLLSSAAIVGNPPYGRRWKLASQFINRGLETAGMVAFVLPLTFQKWFAQKTVRSDARLVLNHPLPETAFTHMGNDFDARTTFQVWTLGDKWPDLRLKAKPPSRHPDFKIIRADACVRRHHPERFANDNWDFAVPRTGCYDFTEKLWNGDPLVKGRDYALFSASTPAVRRRLLMIDYQALSRRSTIRPAISWDDVVAVYELLVKEAA